MALKQITPPTSYPVTRTELKEHLVIATPDTTFDVVRSIDEGGHDDVTGASVYVAGWMATAILTVGVFAPGQTLGARLEESHDLLAWTPVPGGEFPLITSANDLLPHAVRYRGDMGYIRVVAAVPTGTVNYSASILRQWIGIDDNDLLDSLIGAATTQAEVATRRQLMPATWRKTLDRFPGCLPGDNAMHWADRYAIDLEYAPIQSIDSVKYYDTDGVLQTMSASDYLLDSDSEPGRLLPAVGTSWPATEVRPNAVVIEYDSGYAAASDIPKQLPAAIKLAAGHLYRHREEDAPLPAVLDRLFRMSRVGSWP
jgi:uncharacterized phiE125 gp8 family phage protein